MNGSGSFKKDFWTKVLGENGLESPGYHEAVKEAIEFSKRKKELKDQAGKSTKKKKK